MDETTLEISIRRECEETIAAIREKESHEIRRLDIQNQAAIDSIRKQAGDETDEHIRQELVRLENKAILEHQKLRLKIMEDFINRLVENIMKDIRTHPRYPQFLLDAIGRAVKETSGRAQVHLTPGDLSREEEIQSAVNRQQTVIAGDPSIRWGGCLVLDEENGRIFNSTLERIYFRKSPQIRRMVAGILKESAGITGKNP